MNIAVLMTCHNRKETTLRCLRALHAATKELERGVGVGELTGHVFLVDDGSTDGTGEAVRGYAEQVKVKGQGRQWWSVHLIQGDGTLFWARGMALAWREALKHENDHLSPTPTLHSSSFTHFLWLNDDVELFPDALSSLMEDYQSIVRHGSSPSSSISPVLVGACSADASRTKSSYAATTRQDVQIFPNGKFPVRADGWFNGNCVLVPHDVYERVGILSDEYSHARADYDYAERLKRAGVPFYASSQFVGVCANDHAIHFGGLPLGRRLRLLWTPSACNLADLLRFKRRYFGSARAVLSGLHLLWIVIRG